MKRRDSLKVIAATGVVGVAATTVSCKTDGATAAKEVVAGKLYGRTPDEKEWDKKVMAETFLTDSELKTISVLSDIILPAKGDAGSATDAGVPEFIEFIVKDLPDHQLPIRGGLMWLNGESTRRYNKAFVDCSKEEQIAIVDDIAYPLEEGEVSDMSPGIKFFDKMRDLTLTGYYTTKMGFQDLGYKGNIPGVWDGVPEEVLAKHSVDYDPAWIAKCVDQEKRGDIAEWDDDMNLIT